jgi:hypothetical protein
MDPVSAFLLLAITYGGPKVVDAVIGLAVSEGWDLAKGTVARWRSSPGQPTNEDVSSEVIEAATRHISAHAATARTVTDAVLAPPATAGSPQGSLEAVRTFIAGVFAAVGDSGLAALQGSLSSAEAVTVVDTRSSRHLYMPPIINKTHLWFPPIWQALEMGVPRMWVTGAVPLTEREQFVTSLRERFTQRDLLGREQPPSPITLNAVAIATYGGLSDARRVAKVGQISHREIVLGLESKTETASDREAGMALIDDMRAEEELRLDHAKAGLAWDFLQLKPEGIQSLSTSVRELVADRQLRFDAESAHSRAVAAALSGRF